ncbi:hypothetical protein [Paraburkholderia kururiensis]|uniref:hypothetical protein n=1 Tax=Paraburkholderia kururiensis TaxID=984307 RepID=UPI000F894877|nr:hypothetical protein [Paraburkholderia kururiensis]
MNNEDLLKQLESLETSGLAETAERLLPPLLEIDDPEEAATEVAQLAGLPPEAVAEIEALAQETGRSSLSELKGLLRMVLTDLADTQPDGEASVFNAAAAAGRKLIVVGPELYGICTLLIAGYIVTRSGGKQSMTRDIEISTGPDGRTKTKIREQVIYLNPFGPLAKLLKRVTGVAESSDD